MANFITKEDEEEEEEVEETLSWYGNSDGNISGASGSSSLLISASYFFITFPLLELCQCLQE